MSCADNGRPAEEPTRMLAVLILQFMEGLPDRKAVGAYTDDLRWKLTLGMESDEPAFHATSLVKFRNRGLEHNLVEIGFDAVLGAMRKAGYLQAHKAQRLDSTHVLGRVRHMSRVECIREALRLALETLVEIPEEQRPKGWSLWWERYLQTTLDFRTDDCTLQEKMIQSGQDARAMQVWVKPVIPPFTKPGVFLRSQVSRTDPRGTATAAWGRRVEWADDHKLDRKFFHRDS